MANAEEVAIAKLDGRDPESPNYIALQWTGVTLYQEWDFGKNWVNRPAGADPGKIPGESWWSTSELDKVTVLAEILAKKYHGFTVLHMLSALFAVEIEGRPVTEVRKALGIS